MLTFTQFCIPGGKINMSGWDGRGIVAASSAYLTGEIDGESGLPIAELDGKIVCDEGEGALFDAWWDGGERQYPQDGDIIDVMLRHDFTWGGENFSAPAVSVIGAEELPLLIRWMWENLLPQFQPQADSLGIGDTWRSMVRQRSAEIADSLAWGRYYTSSLGWAAGKVFNALDPDRSVGDRVDAILEIARAAR